MRDFLLDWYDAHRRELPWRKAQPDPYAVWVSEIMLQQTRVSVVVPYFERWMLRFPSVTVLAESSLDDVYDHWQGLGYYRRARALHQGAKLVREFGFPNDRKGWEALPGIGSYTAGAILSIAFGQPEPAVDGNVERVFARLFAVRAAKPELNQQAKRWLTEFLVGERPGDVTQALMELGATVCLPRNPHCEECPLAESCAALKANLVNELPVPPTRPQFIDKAIFLRIPVRGDLIGWNRLPEKSWGAGLYGFPRIEGPGAGPELAKVKHTITHHRIFARAHLDEGGDAERWTTVHDTTGLAITALDAKILKLIRRHDFFASRNAEPTLTHRE